MKTSLFRSTALTLVLAIGAAVAPANVDPKKGRVTANPTKGISYSLDQEVQLGRQASAEIQKDLPLLPANHPTSKYIKALGEKLAATAPGYKFPYTFRVVKQKEINAFAMPGGPIYMNVGTIEAASEAELAGVMGHEIAHVVMRHSARQASKQAKAQLPLAILSGVLGVGVGGWAGSLAQMGISLGAGSVFMKYSRDAETEADMVGTQIIYDTGYDPRAMVTFFEKLPKQQGGAGGPSFLASHPDPGDRAKNVAGILLRFPPKQYPRGDSPEFLAAKQALSDVTAQTDAQTAATEPLVWLKRLTAQEFAASPTSKSFDHTAYRVSYPENWRLKGDRNTSVTIYPEGGASDESVAYGAILSGFQPGRDGNRLDEAMQQLVQSVQDTNPNLKPAGKTVDLSVSGRAAQALEFLGTSAVTEHNKPIPERVRLIALQGKGNMVLYLVFVAPDGDFDALRPSFDGMVRSYQVR
ncbi:MAG TPA: M48 family metallopeptidase [Terriglobales bacterium]|nr:M48 family metallopeptidase [Terriglobales bacterium]